MSNKMRAPNLSNAKIGDKLWDAQTGEWITIETIWDHQTTYFPIRFTKKKSCTFDGRSVLEEPPRYFWQPFTIPDECLTPPEPTYEFKAGDPVCVRAGGIWHCRVFVRYLPERNRFVCRPAADPTSNVRAWAECVPYDRTLLGFDEVITEDFT